jgi:Uma2 family endonuclease
MTVFSFALIPLKVHAMIAATAALEFAAAERYKMEQLVTQPVKPPMRQPVTAEQLVQISQDDTHRYELIRGELIVMSPTGGRHAKLAARLHTAISVFAEEHALGETYIAEPGFRLAQNPDTVLAPDVSLILSANLTPGRVTKAFIPGAPDLVVEVLAPSDTAAQTVVKVQTWLRHSAQLVWVVEPESETVTVYRADRSAALLKSTDILDGEQILPGFAYPLERLFR